jgi:predicted CopG family antitoxin
MTTTIQIDDETQEMLKKLRKTLHAETYNEVINKLIMRPLKQEQSMYGFLGKSDRKKVLKGLRDEKDRI